MILVLSWLVNGSIKHQCAESIVKIIKMGCNILRQTKCGWVSKNKLKNKTFLFPWKRWDSRILNQSSIKYRQYTSISIFRRIVLPFPSTDVHDIKVLWLHDTSIMCLLIRPYKMKNNSWALSTWKILPIFVSSASNKNYFLYV